MKFGTLIRRWTTKPRDVVLGLWEYYYTTYIHTTEHKITIALVTICGVLLAVHPAFAVVGAMVYLLPLFYFYSTDPDLPTPANIDSVNSGERDNFGSSTTGKLDLETLQTVSDDQRARTISLLGQTESDSDNIVDRKYDPDLYVERTQTLEQFNSFRHSEKGVFAVVGEAGMGKTNFLCDLAERVGEDSPVLFYNGVGLNQGLKNEIVNDLSDSCNSTTFDGIATEISEVVKQSDTEFFVFIDGLNECMNNREDLRSDLDDIAQMAESSPWRIVLSCRTRDWEYWYRDETRMILNLGRQVFTPSDTNQKIRKGVELGELSDEEFREMWQTYKTEFGLKGNLSDLMKELCREPFMMRLVSEIYTGGKEIPEYVEPISLFDRYLDEKFPSERVRMNIRRLLFSLAEKMLKEEKPSVSIAELDPDSDKTLDRLLDENILIYRDSTDIFFHFDLFLEYVIAQYLLSTLDRDSTPEQRKEFVVSQTERELRNIPGVVETILLSWSDDTESLRLSLEALGSCGPKWQSIVCSTLRKLQDVPESLDSVVEMLAKSDNYIIRTYISQSCSSFINSNGWDTIENLAANDTSWRSRETAANIIGYEMTLNDTTRRIVSDLTNDYHWRVRRAAGYTLNQLWSEHSQQIEEFRRLVLTQAEESTWREKHAISIGLLGTNLDNKDQRGTEIVFDYAQDGNPHVRWLIANYLPRYKGNRRKELVRLLTEDPSPWVRRKLVESVSALSNVDREFKYDCFNDLIHDDDDSVRLFAIRQAENLKESERVAETIANVFENETQNRNQSSDIAVAAAYTLQQIGFADKTEDIEKILEHNEKRRYREMIARRDLDFAESRFLSVQSYISRRTEFVQRSDPYMEIIDTMCSLIDGASVSIANETGDMIEFFECLLEDVDEGVRWALVVYLARYDESRLEMNTRFDMLTELSRDSHHWVRREVATVLGMKNFAEEMILEKEALLREMKSRENEISESCSDEVIHFIDKSLKAIETSDQAD